MNRLLCFVLLLPPLGCDDPSNTPTEPSAPEVDAPEPSFDGLDGFLPRPEVEAILERTERLTLSADVDGLTPGERAAIDELMAVGAIFERLYEDAKHVDALRVRAHLEEYEPSDDDERAHLAGLRDLYALFEGPVVWDLAGERRLLGPIAPYDPRRNIHPPSVHADRVRAHAARDAAAEHGDLLGTRTVIRPRTEEALAADRATLEAHPFLGALHPDLAARLAVEPASDDYYAVPYALAHVEPLLEASRHLFAASAHVRSDDRDLADYLEQRARDLLTNDYEAGDAVWVSARPARLNALVGAYETYDDDLLSVKAAYAVSILVRSDSGTAELESAVSQLQRFEDALPGGPYQRVRSRIPIGIYRVYADFGQSRGGNTATILPNEAHIAARYGRTILIRENILRAPAIVARGQARFAAAVVPEQASDLREAGNFDRTVWHEVGHYLGPKSTEDGRDIDQALTDLQNHFEELKADLVSLWMMPRLAELGVLSEERVRSAYAAGVLRTLRPVEPSRENPYGTMNLMQNNYFLEHGLLTFDAESAKLHIDYARYSAVVAQMLAEVVGIQRAGDHAAAEAFVDRYAVWNEDVQGIIGAALDGAGARYTFVRYESIRDL